MIINQSAKKLRDTNSTTSLGFLNLSTYSSGNSKKNSLSASINFIANIIKTKL